jgi:hypothetical protein
VDDRSGVGSEYEGMCIVHDENEGKGIGENGLDCYEAKAERK